MWYSWTATQLPRMDESLYQKFTLHDPSIDLLQTLNELIDFESASLQFELQLQYALSWNNSECLTKAPVASKMELVARVVAPAGKRKTI